MPTAINEFEARVEAVRADLEFVRLAAQLRPRIGSILVWDAQGDGTDIAKQFMRAKSIPEGVYASLLVRLIASLERYLRNMIAEVVYRRAQKAKSYDELAATLGSRNLVLTGKLLASLDQPRDYLTLDVDELIENLASCKKGNSTFKLNLLAFSASMVGVTPMAIEKAMDTVDVSSWLDRIGADSAVAAVLGTKGTHATGERVKYRLKELSRWRNHVAHGGDGHLSVSDTDLSDAISFVQVFGKAINTIVQ